MNLKREMSEQGTSVEDDKRHGRIAGQGCGRVLRNNPGFREAVCNAWGHQDFGVTVFFCDTKGIPFEATNESTWIEECITDFGPLSTSAWRKPVRADLGEVLRGSCCTSPMVSVMFLDCEVGS